MVALRVWAEVLTADLRCLSVRRFSLISEDQRDGVSGDQRLIRT